MRYGCVPLELLSNRKRSLGAVFGVLSYHQGQKGTCWPSLATIAAESGISDRSNVVRVINELVRMGFVERLGRRGKGGSMQYRTHLAPVVKSNCPVVKSGSGVVPGNQQLLSPGPHKENKKTISTEEYQNLPMREQAKVLSEADLEWHREIDRITEESLAEARRKRMAS